VTIHAGYLVDLRGVQFDDAASSTWVHALSLGSFYHPIHGEIKVTPERISRFAKNLTDRIRGIDTAIDYDHRAHGGDAAGWVRKAEPRSDGLWVFVEWTKSAYAKIKEGAYRYFSPEFVDEWEHPETRVKFQDVLLGGGITNRPFLKNLVPINMTEIVNTASGGTSMDPAEVLKALAKLFGLPEDTDPGVILGHAQAKIKPEGNENPDDPNDPDKQTGTPSAPGQQQSEEAKTKIPVAADDKDKGTQFTEEQLKGLQDIPFVKTLMETVTNQGKKLDEQAVNEAVVKLSETAAGKNVAIPPVVKDGLKKQLSETPPDQRAGLIKLFEMAIENGALGVALGEKGHSGHEVSKTAVKALNDAVNKKMTDNKLSYADAVSLVATEQPNLYVEYQRELASV
jgi:hypothetical protein